MIGRGLVALLAVGLSACQAGDTTQPPIARTSSALAGTSLGYGGQDDTVNLPTANVVVEMREGDKRCSGTLISPLVVLTAGHCILGTAETNLNALGLKPPVTVGAPRPGLIDVTDLAADHAVTRLGHATAQNELGSDVALVFMDETALQANIEDVARAGSPFAREIVLWNTLLEVRSERPSFEVPPSNVEGDQFTFLETVGVAGFGGTDVRQVAFFGELTLTHGPRSWQQPQGTSKEPLVNVAEIGGDSGGPLFTIRPGRQTRDPLAFNRQT